MDTKLFEQVFELTRSLSDKEFTDVVGGVSEWRRSVAAARVTLRKIPQGALKIALEDLKRDESTDLLGDLDAIVEEQPSGRR